MARKFSLKDNPIFNGSKCRGRRQMIPNLAYWDHRGSG